MVGLLDEAYRLHGCMMRAGSDAQHPPEPEDRDRNRRSEEIGEAGSSRGVLSASLRPSVSYSLCQSASRGKKPPRIR